MSVVAKTAKAGLYLLGLLVLLLVAAGVYLYMNVNILAKQMSEQAASKALGVAVTIDDMQIGLEEKKIVVSGIQIANPNGYKKDHAVTIGEITIAAESISSDLLTFARVSVDDTIVNVEVRPQGTNLGDIKNYIAQHGQKPSPEAQAKQPKVIVREFLMTKAQLNPSVTLIEKDMAFVKAPDLRLTGIGEKEGGVAPQEAIAQISAQVLQHFNKSANRAGFLQGLSLEALNEIGVSTIDVFKKNLKENFDEDVDQFKDGVDQLKKIFE